MSRPLRRLVAGALAAGSLLALAPVADAGLPCWYVVVGGRQTRVCPPTTTAF